MKKITIFILAGLMLLTLPGCEDFLDKREDAGGLEEKDVYASYESIRGFLDRAYDYLDDFNNFNDANSGHGRTYIGVMADEMAAVYNSTRFATFFSGSWLQTAKSSGVTEIGNGETTPIGKAYRGMRIVNRVIANIDKAPLTSEQYNEILGQAYFYRAWFYFQVIKRYGGMPLIDKVFAGGDDDLPRKTYRESSEWMISDIEKAVELLPDTWEDLHYGRPTKLAAMAFKGMALLYQASPLMQNNLETTEVKEYDKECAARAAKAIWEAIEYMNANQGITGTRLATKDEYVNTFWFPRTTLKQAEHIWARRFIPGQTNMTKTLRAFWLYPEMAQGTGSEAFAMSCPTLNATEMYERKGADGKYYPITDSRSGYKFDPEHAFTDRDPRFYNNILIPGDEWGQYKDGNPYYIRLWVGSKPYNDFLTSKHSNGRQISGFMCRKFLWPEVNEQYNSDKKTWTLNIAQTVYIRTSQLYLDFAEASFEATGSAKSQVEGCGMTAEQALNVIRERIGVTPVVADIASDPAKFREAYRRERGVELMFENHRWWDVRRWMIMHELFKDAYPLKGVKFHPANGATNYNGTTPPEGGFTYEVFDMIKETRAFTMRNYWYPLPQHDVDALYNLKQNPGW